MTDTEHFIAANQSDTDDAAELRRDQLDVVTANVVAFPPAHVCADSPNVPMLFCVPQCPILVTPAAEACSILSSNATLPLSQ